MKLIVYKSFIISYLTLALSCTLVIASNSKNTKEEILQYKINNEKTAVGSSIVMIENGKIEYWFYIP